MATFTLTFKGLSGATLERYLNILDDEDGGHILEDAIIEVTS